MEEPKIFVFGCNSSGIFSFNAYKKSNSDPITIIDVKTNYVGNWASAQ